MSEENIIKETKRTRTSDSIAKIGKALSQLQLEITNPANTAVNPFYKSKYAPLPDVLTIARPILGKYGLSIIQNPYNEGDMVLLSTLLIHESGEWIETNPLILKPEKNTPQGIGSAITYGRRYVLSSVLGISSQEDDDGNTDEKPQDKINKALKEDETKSITRNIASVAKEKASVSEEAKTKVKEILVKYHSSGNPNKIEDIKLAKQCLEEINNIK